mgnify:CR=1 FL=1
MIRQANEEAEKNVMGFGANDNFDDMQIEEVKRFFAPEFRNRLDGIINFNNLSNQNLESVVEKLNIDVEAKLNEKGIDIDFDSDVVKLILEQGYDPKLGARPLSRAVDKLVKKPISTMLIEDKIKRGSSVKLSVQDKKIVVKASNSKEKIT